MAKKKHVSKAEDKTSETETKATKVTVTRASHPVDSRWVAARAKYRFSPDYVDYVQRRKALGRAKLHPAYGRRVAAREKYNYSQLTEALDSVLDGVKNQVRELHETTAEHGQIGDLAGRLEAIEKAIDQAGEKSEQLKANLLLPPPEDMNVPLVPSFSLDRLEEYRVDENKAYLLIGVTLGAIFGVVSNWFTSPNFDITPASALFVAFLFLLSLLFSTWAFQVGRRARKVRENMLYSSSEQSRSTAIDEGSSGKDTGK